MYSDKFDNAVIVGNCQYKEVVKHLLSNPQVSCYI